MCTTCQSTAPEPTPDSRGFLALLAAAAAADAPVVFAHDSHANHDDLVPVFNAQSEVLTERYGEFFIAELIEAQDDRNRGESDSDSPSIPL